MKKNDKDLDKMYVMNEKDVERMYVYGQMILKKNIRSILKKTLVGYSAIDVIKELEYYLFYDGWFDLEKEMKRRKEIKGIEEYEGDE